MKIGESRTFKRKVLECVECGYPLDGDMCRYTCPNDGEHDGSFVGAFLSRPAVYEVTEKYLGEKE
jgi:hypothetical protein